MKNHADIIILGSGNAALCAGLAAIERGASVLILFILALGGFSLHSAGLLRTARKLFSGDICIPANAWEDGC